MNNRISFYHINKPYIKYFLCLIIFLFISVCNYSQTSKYEKVDTIYLKDGRKLLVTNLLVLPTKVKYRLVNDTKTEELDRSQIEQIKYNTGQREISNKPVYSTNEFDAWKKVILTENERLIQGLKSKGEIEATSPEGEYNSVTLARKSAEVQLQKKAADMGATIIFVVKRNATGGFGESPGYYIKGIAYSK
jgi:hypothetical protein